MSGAWKNCTLGEVITLQRGFDLPKKQRGIGEVPVVSSSGISGTHNVAKVSAPGVVTGRYGTLGKSFYITEDFWPLNTTLFVRDFKGNDPRFISYLLKTLGFENQNVAGAVPGVNRNFLHMLPVNLPPLDQQIRISSILSTYDDLIENNTRRIRILEQMAQSLYREWFVHFRFAGHEKVKLVNSTLGKIPEGWEITSINRFLSIKSGFAFSSKIFNKNGPYGLVTIKNVQDGSFINRCQNYIKDIPSNLPQYCVLRDGDILISLTGNIGRVCLVSGDGYLLNQRVAKLLPYEEKNYVYAYLLFRQQNVRKRLESIATGVAQQNLSPIKTGEMEVLLPPDELLRNFSNICSPKVEAISIMFRKIENLRRTRDFLLPKLISSEIKM